MVRRRDGREISGSVGRLLGVQEKKVMGNGERG